MAYQEMLKGLELKRDMEAILVGTNQAKNAGTSSVARVTASVLSWTSRHVERRRRRRSFAARSGTRTDGTQRVFTEANLKSVLQSVWNTAASPTHHDGRLQQAGVLDLHGALPRSRRPSPEITASVDAYESDSAPSKWWRPLLAAAPTSLSCRPTCGRSPT